MFLPLFLTIYLVYFGYNEKERNVIFDSLKLEGIKMTIGELLKDYRISQKKTQKQWAKDVISPSFYAKVEKNLSRISAEDLIELLHSNQIPVIDFFSKLNQKDKSINQQELEINRLINEAYYQNSKKELQQIRDVVAEGELPNKNDELLLIDAYIAVISKDLTMLDKEVIDRMKEKVFNISNFDEDGLIMYCNFMSFYDLNSNLLLSKRIIKQLVGSSSVRIQEKILAIIINMLIFCIRNKRFEETEVFVNYADQIKTKPEVFFYKLLIPAFYNIVKYQNNHDKKYLDETEIIIKSIKLAGMPDYGKELEELLVANK
ncbi:helix-turn-helix domain-containing protein [Lactobacillus melliventris]|nr:Rgg/GadR/MutR family transcriptional regulator [Lactobacillus melliventris]